MDRALKETGLTLLELLIVLAAVGIILGISVPIYRNWMKKVSIENDTKLIFSVLVEAKARSFSEKRICGVFINGKKVCLRCDTDSDDEVDDETEDLKSFLLKNSFAKNFSYVKFDKDGIANITGTVYSEDTSVEPAYSCVKISKTRIKMGRWDGSECQAR